MRIIKPLRLGLLTRPYQHLGRHQLGVAVLALATMDPDPVLLPEAALWQLTGSLLDEDEAVDLAMPKPCAEFLASGKAYSHDAQSPGRCAVRIQVADKEKSLLVTGRRAWVNNVRTTEPEPVHGLPVNWRHTYGGPGVEENPVGMGASVDAQGLRMAPCVEAFDDRMHHAGDVCGPVSFGPVSPLRPRRFKLCGEYDPRYVQNAFPGLPNTLDPHFFNTASPDQWFAGQPELPSGAPYQIDNMHPVRPVLRGKLPRWRARAFVCRHEHDELDEVVLRHTTVWFFPDQERMLLIFHGAVPVDTDDGSDLALIMPALEQSGKPRDLAHYRRTLALRLPRDEGAVHALKDSDLVPASLIREIVDTRGALSMPMAVNQRQRAEHLKRDMMDMAKQHGQDPALYQLDIGTQPGAPAGLEDLPEQLRRARRRVRQAKVQALRERRAADTRLEAAFQDMPLPAGMEMNDLKQGVQDPLPGGPPKAAERRAASQARALAREWRKHDPDSAVMSQIANQVDEMRGRVRAMYRHTAHLQQSAPTASPGRTQRMRRRVQSLMQGSRDLSGLDLTGVDLSGLDLSSARCLGTWMECADLSNARLTGADLREAVLTRAMLNRTDCQGADFRGANLGGMLAVASSFHNARFDEAILNEARFEHCTLRGAILRDSTPAGIEFVNCDFSAARLERLVFMQDAFLYGGQHGGAHLERVTWMNSMLANADYAEATLNACVWVQCEFETPATFRHAAMSTCAVVMSALPGADFGHALLRECNLRGIELEGADFASARLLNSDLSESRLRGASFHRADARSSLFMGCDLQNANLAQADFIDALMSKSDFREADLRGANLFRADISQSRLDHTTRTAGAYVKLAKTLPAATPEPS